MTHTNRKAQKIKIEGLKLKNLDISETLATNVFEIKGIDFYLTLCNMPVRLSNTIAR